MNDMIRMRGIVIAAVAVWMTAGVVLAQGVKPPVGREGQLSGRVVDDKGKPVADAELTLAGPTFQAMRTDADGKYSIGKLPAGGYSVGVRASGFLTIDYYRPGAARVMVSAGGRAEQNFALERGAVIEVTVNDLLGAPMEGAAVNVCLSDRQDRGRQEDRKETNPGGIATFTVAPSKTPYLISVTKADHEPTHEMALASSLDGPHAVEVTLLPSTPVKGIAICSDGKPASGWKVSAAPSWWVSNYIPREETIDADGHFTLSEVGPGPYMLTVWKGNRGTVPIAARFPPTSQPYRLDLPYPSPASLATLSGRVRLTGGRPDYLQVNASGPGNDWNDAQVNFGPMRPRKAGATEPASIEGTFKFVDMQPGIYRITFQSPMVESKTIENVKVPGDMPLVELRMTGKPHLHGTVVDAATRKAIAQYQVRATKVTSIGNGANYVQDREWTAVNNADGKFDIELVGPGIYRAQVAADGYAWAFSNDARIESSDKTEAAEVTLVAGGSLSGVLVDPSGAPLAGAKVIPLSKTRIDGPGSVDGLFGGDAGSVVSDAQGHFMLAHLAAGSESIKISNDRFAPLEMRNLTITEGGATDAGTIKVLAGGVVEGTVYDERGNAASGVALRFQQNYGFYEDQGRKASLVGTATSDASGHYRVEHLPQSTIYVEAGEYQRQGVRRRIVRPVDGKTTTLDFGGTTPVKGRLMVGGKPAASTSIELGVFSEYFGPVMVMGTTDSEGRFTFFGPPPGKYSLFYMPKGERSQYSRASENITIGSQPLDLGDVTIDVGRVTATVQADDPADGKSLAYGSISQERADQPYPRYVARLQHDGQSELKWVGDSVPAGKLQVSLQSQGGHSVSYSASFERAAGAVDTAVTVHVPKSTAQLSVKLTGTMPESYRGQRFAELRSTDAAISTYVSTNEDKAVVVKLPPGTYQVMSGRGKRAREDVASIELKDGESKEVEIPMLAATDETKRSVRIALWTGDGLPVLDATIKLVGVDGKAADAAQQSDTALYFTVAPGRYRATIDRPGAASFAADVDASAVGDAKSRSPVNVDLTVP